MVITGIFCSLSLPYAAGLLLLQFCMKHFNDFAIVDIPSFDHQTCATNMWRNLFYIDQFYPLDERVSGRRQPVKRAQVEDRN